MRKIIKTQIVQWKSNAEFIAADSLVDKDWDVIISVVNFGDYQNTKQFTCKNLDEANSILRKGDEIVKYEFRLWDDDGLNSYNIDTKEIHYRTRVIKAKNEDEAREKVKGDRITEIEIISITKNER